NLLTWHGRLWLIDHGAALYIHHSWQDPTAHARQSFERIRDHVLLPFAGPIADADGRLAARLTEDTIAAIVELVPDAWLTTEPTIGGPAQLRRAYVDYLTGRLAEPREFVAEADRARAA
ncbi:MAG TPA: aminotransferase class I and II, partial [Candidatus Binatia bacterium]|nr:aminotransferase class I and II [Candidatus Binatia bacterium]